MCGIDVGGIEAGGTLGGGPGGGWGAVAGGGEHATSAPTSPRHNTSLGA